MWPSANSVVALQARQKRALHTHQGNHGDLDSREQEDDQAKGQHDDPQTAAVALIGVHSGRADKEHQQAHAHQTGVRETKHPADRSHALAAQALSVCVQTLARKRVQNHETDQVQADQENHDANKQVLVLGVRDQHAHALRLAINALVLESRAVTSSAAALVIELGAVERISTDRVRLALLLRREADLRTHLATESLAIRDEPDVAIRARGHVGRRLGAVELILGRLPVVVKETLDGVPRARPQHQGRHDHEEQNKVQSNANRLHDEENESVLLLPPQERNGAKDHEEHAQNEQPQTSVADSARAARIPHPHEYHQ